MTAKRPSPGTVIRIDLPNGRYAFGRVYRDAAIGIYRETPLDPGKPPIGSRDFQFIVGVFTDVITSGKCPLVGMDPFGPGEDPFPPPTAIIDPVSGDCSIYHRGVIRPAVEQECRNLEVTAVWDLEHIVDRVLNGSNSRYLKGLESRKLIARSTIH